MASIALRKGGSVNRKRVIANEETERRLPFPEYHVQLPTEARNLLTAGALFPPDVECEPMSSIEEIHLREGVIDA